MMHISLQLGNINAKEEDTQTDDNGKRVRYVNICVCVGINNKIKNKRFVSAQWDTGQNNGQEFEQKCASTAIAPKSNKSEWSDPDSNGE